MELQPFWCWNVLQPLHWVWISLTKWGQNLGHRFHIWCSTCYRPLKITKNKWVPNQLGAHNMWATYRSHTKVILSSIELEMHKQTEIFYYFWLNKVSYKEVLLPYMWVLLRNLSIHPNTSRFVHRLNMCRKTANLVSKVIQPPAEFELMLKAVIRAQNTMPHLQAIGAAIGYHRSPPHCLYRYEIPWPYMWGSAWMFERFFGLVHTINGNNPSAILIFCLKKAVNKYYSLLLIVYIHVYMEWDANLLLKKRP